MTYTLVLGTKNWSSWSLRPYVALRATGAPFSETVISLYRAETREKILAHSPTGRVPVLEIEDNGARSVVWDSLAICETLAERHPEAHLWPKSPLQRAKARAMAAEMHAGFANLREQLPMDFARHHPLPELSAGTKADIDRILAAWEEALTTSGGPYLFGDFSIADAMYAPEVSRFHTYGVALPPHLTSYGLRILGLPAMQSWMLAAKAEIACGDAPEHN